MSHRTAQCIECTDVFDVESATGRLPARCSKCRKDEKERGAAPPPARSALVRTTKRVTLAKRSTRSTAKPAPRARASEVKGAIAFLEGKLEALDAERTIVEDAIAALTALTTSNGRHR